MTSSSKVSSLATSKPVISKQPFSAQSQCTMFGMPPTLGYGPAMMSRLPYMPMYSAVHPMFLLNQYSALQQFAGPRQQQQMSGDASSSATSDDKHADEMTRSVDRCVFWCCLYFFI